MLRKLPVNCKFIHDVTVNRSCMMCCGRKNVRVMAKSGTLYVCVCVKRHAKTMHVIYINYQTCWHSNFFFLFLIHFIYVACTGGGEWPLNCKNMCVWKMIIQFIIISAYRYLGKMIGVASGVINHNWHYLSSIHFVYTTEVGVSSSLSCSSSH